MVAEKYTCIQIYFFGVSLMKKKTSKNIIQPRIYYVVQEIPSKLWNNKILNIINVKLLTSFPLCLIENDKIAVTNDIFIWATFFFYVYMHRYWYYSSFRKVYRLTESLLGFHYNVCILDFLSLSP